MMLLVATAFGMTFLGLFVSLYAVVHTWRTYLALERSDASAPVIARMTEGELSASWAIVVGDLVQEVLRMLMQFGLLFPSLYLLIGWDETPIRRPFFLVFLSAALLCKSMTQAIVRRKVLHRLRPR